MKAFDKVKEMKDKTVTFCKNHKEGLIRGGCLVAGIAAAYILEERRYDTTNLDGDFTVMWNPEKGCVGFEQEYSKPGKKPIKHLTTKRTFINLDDAEAIGNDLLNAVKELR